MTDGSTIALASVGRRFGKEWAIRDASFSVAPGQVVGFLGANGAGKTTTIRMILGLLSPTEGDLHVLGQRVPADVAVMRRVGSASERPHFYGWLSAEENLRVVLGPLGIGRNEIRAAIDRVGLASVMSRRVRTFSNGMRARLALARAICGEPAALVLDEPTSGLDPGWVGELRVILGELAAGGVGVLFSSHLLTEVERSCDHVVVLREGTVLANAPVSELMGRGWQELVLAPDQVDEAIAALGRFTTERRGDVVRVRAETGQEISRILMNAGIAPESIKASQSSLEELFFPPSDGPA